MDALFWRGDWRPVAEAEYLAAHARLVAGDRWVIEGYVNASMARLQRADRIIFLDYPGGLCAWRVVKRWLRHRRTARSELPAEARERLSLKFLWIVVTRAERAAILEAMAGVDAAKIVRATSPRSPIPPL
jgi:adenylate kinase family enzyme